MQVEAKGERVKKEIDHIRVERAKNGGHVVTHHHRHFAHEPETHVFGPGEHEKLMSHLVKHLGLELPDT